MKKTATQIASKAVAMNNTIDELVTLFLDLKSTTFVQIWQSTQTISRMRKTGNRFAGKIYKMNCLNCVTNYSYQNMVNKARTKESMQELIDVMIGAGVPQDKIDNFINGAKSDIKQGAEKFVSAGLPFGNYVDDSKCIIDHTPASGPFANVYGYYIQVSVLNYATPVYRWIDNDVELTADEVEEMKTFITPAKPSTSQGLSKPYVIRSPRWETIESITLNKINHRLVG